MIYTERPQNFNPKFEIVSCFLERNGEILLLHRQDSKPQGNTWGVPAGKTEDGEKIDDAVCRELKEETDYGVSKNKPEFIRTVFVQYEDYDFVYHIYRLVLEEDFIVKIDAVSHKDFKWTNPQEALGMNLIQDLDACIKLCYVDCL